MISNELLEEVIAVSSKGKFISKGLLLRVAFNAIEQLDYVSKSKLREFKIEHFGWDFGLACCDRTKGIIIIDYERLIKQEKQTKIFSYLRANLSIIQYVLHEIEHLNEHYKITKNDIQAKLINISSGNFVSDVIYENLKKTIKNKKKLEDAVDKKFEKFQEKNWNIIPLEKIAEADSQKKLVSSVENYPNFVTKYPKLYEYLLNEYLISLHTGYEYNEKAEKYEAPIFKYLRLLKMNGCNIRLEEIGLSLKPISEQKTNILLENKFKYGFSVKKDEVKALEDKVLKKSTK